MVPHVNRQEIYAGGKYVHKSIYDERHYGYKSTDNDQMHVSPIDFFEAPKLPEYKKKFPHYANASRNMIYLDKGDCVFMPAFYFYQVKGFNLKEDQQLGTGKFESQMSTIVSLQFRGNSELLNGFWDAIEKNILK
jgi:hypothetical protein